MALDPTLIAIFAGAGGVVINRLADLALERLKRKDAKTLGLSQHISEQSRLLFEQQGLSIKTLWDRLDTTERELREAEQRAELVEAQAQKVPRLELELATLRDQFADAKRRLALYAAGRVPEDDPPYDLPYVRRRSDHV